MSGAGGNEISLVRNQCTKVEEVLEIYPLQLYVGKKCVLVVAALPERGPESSSPVPVYTEGHRLARYCKDRQRLCETNIRLEKVIVNSSKCRREDRRRRDDRRGGGKNREERKGKQCRIAMLIETEKKVGWW